MFNKRSLHGFTTSIKNIMAERRFHEFRIEEEFIASFEESICRIEDVLLPVYRRVIETRRLSNDPEEKALLAMLIAFQMLRTRSHRDQFLRIEQQLTEHVERLGLSMANFEGGYEPHDEDSLKRTHIQFMRESMEQFTQIIAQKDFLLLNAAEGRSFYLADNPVALHNDEPKDSIFGNIGLAVRGIQIHLPLSSDLMLCAWCPSILEGIRRSRADQERALSSIILSPRMMGAIRSRAELDRNLAEMRKARERMRGWLQHFEDGTPMPSNSDNMDFYNTMQVGYAREFIVCRRGDFSLAKRYVQETGSGGRGIEIVS